MALERRALLVAFVALCALLLGAGPIGPGEPARGPAATDAVVVAAGATGATPQLITGVVRQASPLALSATIEVAARRRGRRRGRRPVPGPGRARGPRLPFQRPRTTARGIHEFRPRGMGLDELVLRIRY